MKRFLRLREVKHVTGLGGSTIYAMISDGRFPKPTKIAGNRNGWASDQIEDWQADPATWPERQAAAKNTAA
jgi:prophage regulatory protein